ncbi:MAG: hypothetical protein AUG49_02570 [Catenulispora sp. 13_1_20CM_3_70_7]|nr:MAG: hypothetical protein AUG49_02570 [Catenulispora sp. 13_1_20CM_3_70_7]
MSAAGMVMDRHADVFTRGTQHVGLLVATVATALAFGAIYAIVYAFVHRADSDAEPWGRGLGLAGAAFTGVWLLPFLRYPANPPGVGDPGTIGMRTNAWLASIVISLIAVILAWRIHAWLAGRGASAPARQLSVAGIVVVALAVLFALPDNPDAIEVPAKLLWEFRLFSIATTALLWAVLGVTFGLLGLRANRLAAASEKEATAGSAAAGSTTSAEPRSA